MISPGAEEYFRAVFIREDGVPSRASSRVADPQLTTPPAWRLPAPQEITTLDLQRVRSHDHSHSISPILVGARLNPAAPAVRRGPTALASRGEWVGCSGRVAFDSNDDIPDMNGVAVEATITVPSPRRVSGHQWLGRRPRHGR